MQARFWTAALLGFVLIAASACSSGGNNARISDLEKRLQEAEETIEEATAEPEETIAEPVVEPEPEPEPEEVEKEEEVAEEEPEAEEEVQQQAQTLEANQRSEMLLEVLEAANFDSDISASGRVDISVPTRSKLTFEQSDYKVSSISAPDLRGAKLTRERGDTQTTVVYTDIELSRKLVDHYTESSANPGQFTLPAGVLGVSTDFITQSASTVPLGQRLSITHGLRSSIAADAGDRETTNIKAAFSGSVHGVSGTFVCEGADCMLTATGSYNAADATINPNRLSGVTLSSTGTIYFKPSGTGAVSLCADTARCLPVDTAYMAFGWWRSEPASVQGSYEFEPFIAGMGLVDAAGVSSAGGTIKAEYNGVAVGMYVEQQQEGSAIAKKQGEFTADARLDYDATNGLTGTIDGFKTTPTGSSGVPATAGNWIVNLNASNETSLVLRGPDGGGTWRHRFVSDGSAVVGVFEAGQQEVLHIVGAFGAQ